VSSYEVGLAIDWVLRSGGLIGLKLVWLIMRRYWINRGLLIQLSFTSIAACDHLMVGNALYLNDFVNIGLFV
jgi:hypothetical protein